MHLSWIRNLCLFLFIWTSVQFWTSEPICFFYVRSVSAILLFPLCTALPALPGLGPGNRCLQLYLGAEPKGLEPLLLLYVLLLLLGAEPKGLEPLLLLYVLLLLLLLLLFFLGAEPKGLEPLLLLYVLLGAEPKGLEPLLLLYVLLLLLLLLLGAEPEGLDPYCYCMFYYYYYYYIRPMGVYGSPMKGTWENDEIWHTYSCGHE